MKIKKIEIKDYKAFYGAQEINVDSKNLFVYGENGSGKSSLYYALKDFFQASVEPFDYNGNENIFVDAANKGNGHIKVTFNPDKDGNIADKQYSITKTSNDTYEPADTSIRDGLKLKSFLTYKSLLDIHYIKKDQEIDLFDLLVKGVLKHFKSAVITGGVELGTLWNNFEEVIAKPTDRTYNITQKQKDVDDTLGKFNRAFSLLFAAGSPENIQNFAEPILKKFDPNIEIELRYTTTVATDYLLSFDRNHVRVKVKYLGVEIPNYECSEDKFMHKRCRLKLSYFFHVRKTTHFFYRNTRFGSPPQY